MAAMNMDSDTAYHAMPEDEEHKKKKTCAERCASLTPKDYLKICFLLFLAAFFTLAIVESDTTEKVFTDFLNWMQKNLFLGSLAYMLIYTITTVLLIPGSILTLGAGFVFNEVLGTWGVFLATLVVMLGASTGATCAFLLAKTLLRETVEGVKTKYPTFDTIDQVVGIYGFKVTFLLRLSPAIPFNAFNYLMGLTSVKLRHYVAACLGMIPGTIAYCFIGASLGALAKASEVGFSNPTVLIFLVVGTSVTVVGMIILSIYAKKKYAELKEKVVNKNKMSTSTSDANGGGPRDSNSGAAEHSTSDDAPILGVTTQSQQAEPQAEPQADARNDTEPMNQPTGGQDQNNIVAAKDDDDDNDDDNQNNGVNDEPQV